ncbi:DMT family transporter [Streptomyces sp. CA-181903]|uniref:DMT family transporter n=1 Tax=Streptomyces sp. CA-181903 TaxID=3240055 RepID=UPI003D94782E
MATKRGPSNPYLLLMVTMTLWGSAFSSSKAVVGQLPHSVAAFLRFGGAAVALSAASWCLRDRGAREGGRGTATGSVRAAGLAAAAGVLGVFAYNGFFFWGLSLAPSLDAGILIPVMSPVFTSTFLLLTGREKATGARWAGLGLGLAGAAVFLVGAAGGGGDASRLRGDALYLLSAVCWAAYTLLGPRVLAGVEPLRATTYATCAGAALLGVLAAPDLVAVRWGELPSGVWLNSVYLAVGAAAVANLLYYRGVRAVGPARASLMMFTVPVVNIVCATVFLGESVGPLQGAGALVLLLGAAIALTLGRGSRSGTGPRPGSLSAGPVPTADGPANGPADKPADGPAVGPAVGPEGRPEAESDDRPGAGRDDRPTGGPTGRPTDGPMAKPRSEPEGVEPPEPVEPATTGRQNPPTEGNRPSPTRP